MAQLWRNYCEPIFQLAHLDLLLISALMLIVAAVLVRMQRQIAKERKRREEADRQLLNALQRITYLEDNYPQPSPSPTTFEQNLDHAELKNRLQTPVTNGAPPDKYRHIAVLAQQGMSVAQIAEVLNLSLPEANQLVALAKIGNHQP